MAPKIPLNFFAIPFGLIGLADCWLVAAAFGPAPVTLGRVLVAIAGPPATLGRRYPGWIFLITPVLAGYGLLMVVVQVRLLPGYLRLRFMPSLWAFTFSWAAVAIAGRTGLALRRRQLLPVPAPTPVTATESGGR